MVKLGLSTTTVVLPINTTSDWHRSRWTMSSDGGLVNRSDFDDFDISAAAPLTSTASLSVMPVAVITGGECSLLLFVVECSRMSLFIADDDDDDDKCVRRKED
jgi:hypothetical protein